ncbi:MAG: ABC transporter permease [Geminicoccaceae bacterium]
MTGPRSWGEAAALAVLVVVVALLCVWPIVRLGIEAAAPGGRLDLGVMREVLGAHSTWNATWNSIDAALWSSLLALVVGTAFAFLVGATDARAQTPLLFCFVMPLLIPPQITALSWSQLAGPGSPLLSALGLAPPPGTPNPLYSRGGIILLLGLQHAPLVFLTVRAALRRMPHRLVEAAYVFGAGPPQAILRVVLPLLSPALVAGAALAFVSAIGNFGIAALLGIPAAHTLLPVLIYQRLASFGPTVIAEVAVLSVLIAAIAFAGVVVQGWLLRRRDVAAEADGPPVRWRLGRLRRWVEAGAWLFVLLMILLPLVALVATALVPAFGVRLTSQTATFANFTEVLLRQDVTRRAFANSTLLALGAAAALMLLSVPLAYLISWRRGWISRVTHLAAEIPYALPGVVLAVACILIFLRPLPMLGVSIYGTLWIIFVAYLARFLILALTPVIAGYHQIERSLEEAAALDGAGFFERLRFVFGPILLAPVAAGGLLVFMTAYNELTVSALLWSSGSETLGVVVFNLEDGGYTVLAAAVAVLCLIAVFLIFGLLHFLDARFRLGALPWSA